MITVAKTMAPGIKKVYILVHPITALHTTTEHVERVVQLMYLLLNHVTMAICVPSGVVS